MTGHGGGTLKFAVQDCRDSVRLLSLILSLPLGLFVSGAQAQETVDDETCLECHEDYDRSLTPTPHRLAVDLSMSSKVDISCSSCHPGCPCSRPMIEMTPIHRASVCIYHATRPPPFPIPTVTTGPRG